MKKMMCIAAAVLFLAQWPGMLQTAYARRGSDGGGSRHGYDGGSGHRDYYRNYRYYPRDYYHHDRVYFYPRRRYYYFYDVYPEKAYYFSDEKDTYSSNPEYISVVSIVNMASQGVPDEVIIAEIDRTRSVYRLTAEVITYLKQNGCSDRLIDYMLATKYR